jgi:tetratricopeptide (TPR) repeat protein
MILAFLAIGSLAIDAAAERLRAFARNKPLEVSLDLEHFEPDAIAGPKTILGGSTQEGIIITVIEEQERTGMTAAEVRDKYAGPAGATDGSERMQVGDLAVVIRPWSDESSMISVNAYAVKGDVSFDVHLSADRSKQDKEKLLGILKSFRAEETPESKDMTALWVQVRGQPKPEALESSLKAFTAKYPGNSWASCMLAEQYFQAKRIDDAKQAYLQTLRNNRLQPLANPIMLWKCRDGLGMCCGMTREYAASKTQLEAGYDLAKEMDDQGLQAASAYNLACWYAETGDSQRCLQFLSEAIRLVPGNKESARSDSSFNKLQDNPEFQALVAK